MKLHNWIYDIISEVCYDRDYLYACFVRHFTSLLNEIIEKGALVQKGVYSIEGIKSNKKVCLNWNLERRLDWQGSNIVRFTCKIQSSGLETESRNNVFDISTGDSC